MPLRFVGRHCCTQGELFGIHNLLCYNRNSRLNKALQRERHVDLSIDHHKPLNVVVDEVDFPDADQVTPALCVGCRTE